MSVIIDCAVHEIIFPKLYHISSLCLAGFLIASNRFFSNITQDIIRGDVLKKAHVSYKK